MNLVYQNQSNSSDSWIKVFKWTAEDCDYQKGTFIGGYKGDFESRYFASPAKVFSKVNHLNEYIKTEFKNSFCRSNVRQNIQKSIRRNHK